MYEEINRFISHPNPKEELHRNNLFGTDEWQKAKVAFFFKQWGGVFKSHTGRELNGKTWDEMPSFAVTNSKQLTLAQAF